MRTKVVSKEAAIAHVQNGDSIMVGGFGQVGSPLVLIDELLRQGQSQLTIISNNVGEPGKGLSLLLENGRIQKAIGSYFTSNRIVGQYVLENKLDVELVPQGTFAERIRAGGAGIGGFFTRSSAGTLLGEGKEQRIIKGEKYVLEEPLTADVALVRAHKADAHGNLVYRKTARNFNPVMATAANLVIAEVDEVVAPGELNPELVVTPHLYVDYIVVRGASA